MNEVPIVVSPKTGKIVDFTNKKNYETDTKIYDTVVSSWDEYWEMVNHILHYINSNDLSATYEIGIGTGLFTNKLLNTIQNSPDFKYIGIDISEDMLKGALKNGVHEKHILVEDGITYQPKFTPTCIAMTLVYHHIADEYKSDFIQRCYNNLPIGGILIIGDVFITPYQDETQRNHSLEKFHEHRMSIIVDNPTINDEKKKLIVEMEYEALQDGLKRDGEWKTSVDVLLNLLTESKFTILPVNNISNKEEISTYGGYNVIIAQK